MAKELGVSIQKIRAAMTKAAESPEAWEQYKAAGNFTEEQRPAWVGLGKEAAIALEAEEVAKASTQVAKPATSATDAPGSRKQVPIGGLYSWTHVLELVA